jgi:hypothetical protein
MDTELLKEVELLRLEVEKYKPYFTKHVESVKRSELAKYGLEDDYWLNKISGEDEAVITEQVQALVTDLRVTERNQPVDPSNKGNGVKVSYKQTKPVDIGVQAFKRVKESGRLNKHITSIKLEDKPVKVPQAVHNKGIIQRLFGS